MTETTGGVFQSLENEDEYQSTSTVGYIQDHMEAKVVDENGRIVPRGIPGELLVKSYSNMMGYWGYDKKTNDTLSSDGWLRTG